MVTCYWHQSQQHVVHSWRNCLSGDHPSRQSIFLPPCRRRWFRQRSTVSGVQRLLSDLRTWLHTNNIITIVMRGLCVHKVTECAAHWRIQGGQYGHAHQSDHGVHCGQLVLILRKISKIGATRCQILRLRFPLGLRPRPRWGSLQRSPRPPSCI